MKFLGGTVTYSADPRWTRGIDFADRAVNPRPTDQAMADYMELLNRAEVEPAIAVAYQEFLKLRLPVMSSHVNEEATVRAGERVVEYKIHETLLKILLAARAGEREHRDCNGIDHRQK